MRYTRIIKLYFARFTGNPIIHSSIVYIMKVVVVQPVSCSSYSSRIKDTRVLILKYIKHNQTATLHFLGTKIIFNIPLFHLLSLFPFIYLSCFYPALSLTNSRTLKMLVINQCCHGKNIHKFIMPLVLHFFSFSFPYSSLFLALHLYHSSSWYRLSTLVHVRQHTHEHTPLLSSSFSIWGSLLLSVIWGDGEWKVNNSKSQVRLWTISRGKIEDNVWCIGFLHSVCGYEVNFDTANGLPCVWEGVIKERMMGLLSTVNWINLNGM